MTRCGGLLCATIELEIDGVVAETKTSDECTASGCTLAYTWDNSTIPAGVHELHTTVTDNQGNVAAESSID